MKKILLIEDDAVLRENTSELLELSNYTVFTASDGKKGVALASEKNPDIIVCDIMMPELDGYGVLENLSKNVKTKYIPFIFLSAKTERKDVRKGMDLGADDYITKPFNEEELISAIESRIAKAAILKDEREKLAKSDVEDESELRTLNDLKNFFDDNGQTFVYKKDTTIYEIGDNSNFVYLITKGLIKCYKFDEQGKELTTALYKEDDLFGYTSFTQNVPYQETATSIDEVELMGLPKSEIQNILNTNPKLTLDIIELLTDNIFGIKEQLLQMAYSSVHKKTASTIIKFAKKMNRKPEDLIKISRNDLASVAGIATETLIRTLSSFKKQGLIEIEGRSIRIIDLEKLQSIS
ncbi:transcriptional regulator [Polaribacter reichenbachii]|uniref:Transcriptional regulator n=1 Tax=Polaribacter reichenbachii TaxID=996801 RepID=A0A1B8TUM8_9FLAO|nr:response regulator [Polaribacter reichenbachii]APZ45469.1 transcriptional regulator [Polaribacter reichenbachii]AUC19330.1 transcriptional regulator [Polaribacter reichenbachii]OBY63516.1 transcriptional regulator [Polaribacter reichenbachii]